MIIFTGNFPIENSIWTCTQGQMGSIVNKNTDIQQGSNPSWMKAPKELFYHDEYYLPFETCRLSFNEKINMSWQHFKSLICEFIPNYLVNTFINAVIYTQLILSANSSLYLIQYLAIDFVDACRFSNSDFKVQQHNSCMVQCLHLHCPD